MKYILSFIYLGLSACASSEMKVIDVESYPPGGRIELNGITLGNAPAQIKLSCAKHWVGLCCSPDGWAYDNMIYNIEVFPTEFTQGSSQMKSVNACQWHGSGNPKLIFDLRLRQHAPVQDINLKN